MTATASAVDDDNISHNNNNANAEDTIIESYDELEKGIPALYEVLGLLKRIYFMPKDFSNRLVVDRIHKLRTIFSKDEILTFLTNGLIKPNLSPIPPNLLIAAVLMPLDQKAIKRNFPNRSRNT